MTADSRFSRIESGIGVDALNRLRNASVTVIGLGGVGGIATETLARSGVGTLRIIDMEKVIQSNIIRQIIASDATLGQYKVDVMESRLKDINPAITVEKRRVFFHSNSADDLNRENRGRPRRVLGDLGSMISVFGILAAHYVIRKITGV